MRLRKLENDDFMRDVEKEIIQDEGLNKPAITSEILKDIDKFSKLLLTQIDEQLTILEDTLVTEIWSEAETVVSAKNDAIDEFYEEEEERKKQEEEDEAALE